MNNFLTMKQKQEIEKLTQSRANFKTMEGVKRIQQNLEEIVELE